MLYPASKAATIAARANSAKPMMRRVHALGPVPANLPSQLQTNHPIKAPPAPIHAPLEAVSTSARNMMSRPRHANTRTTVPRASMRQPVHAPALIKTSGTARGISIASMPPATLGVIRWPWTLGRMPLTFAPSAARLGYLSCCTDQSLLITEYRPNPTPPRRRMARAM